MNQTQKLLDYIKDNPKKIIEACYNDYMTELEHTDYYIKLPRKWFQFSKSIFITKNGATLYGVNGYIGTVDIDVATIHTSILEMMKRADESEALLENRKANEILNKRL